ncbi:MAG: hypothetical protein PV340_02670 [Wolbachia sp.]|nr:hypothetical protein [Wolbachia sp.]MDD9336176.1 hypothetical protein [Wolbachia sp.]
MSRIFFNLIFYKAADHIPGIALGKREILAAPRPTQIAALISVTMINLIILSLSSF